MSSSNISIFWLNIKYFSSRMTVLDKSILSRLMTEGNYELIIVKIVSFLDLESLIKCCKVCQLWRHYLSIIVKRFSKQFQYLANQNLNLQWNKGSKTILHRTLNISHLLGKLTDKVCQCYLRPDAQVNCLKSKTSRTFKINGS